MFWSGAISVGIAAILFAIAAEWANGVFHKLLAVSPLPLLVTPLGLALILFVTRKHFPGSQGSGIPQVIASLDPKESSKVREQVLSLSVTFGKIMHCSDSLPATIHTAADTAKRNRCSMAILLSRKVTAC